MRGEKKRASLDNKDPKTDVFTAAIQLVRNVSTEHPSANHDDIEWVAAICAHFRPRATDPSTEHIVGKRGFLDIDQGIGIVIQSRQHTDFLPRVFSGRGEPVDL